VYTSLGAVALCLAAAHSVASRPSRSQASLHSTGIIFLVRMRAITSRRLVTHSDRHRRRRRSTHAQEQAEVAGKQPILQPRPSHRTHDEEETRWPTQRATSRYKNRSCVQ